MEQIKTQGLTDNHGWSDTFDDGWTAAISALYLGIITDKKTAKRFDFAAKYLSALKAERAWPVRSHELSRFEYWMKDALDRLSRL